MATFQNGVMSLNGHIINKHGTLAILEASNYVPSAGELIAATDTGQIRVGDGIHAWTNLPDKNSDEITSANSRITTLETDNTSNGTRLTELETAKTTQEAEIAYLLDLSGVNKRSDGKIQYHIRGKNLGTTITAAQYNAICNKNGANPFDVQLGDKWEYWGSNTYIVVRVIERSINYAYLAIAIGTAWPNTNNFLNTQKRSRMHSENDTSVSFANTEMWTENLPLWENYLSENGFPVQYLKKFAHTYYSAPNENGASTAINLTGKLHLFNVGDVCECDYAVTGMKRPLLPYTFFKHARVDAAGYRLQTADPVSATQYVLIQGGNPYVKINATSVLNEVTCLAYIAA